MPPRCGSKASAAAVALSLALAAAACTPPPEAPPDGRRAQAGTIRLAYPEWPATLNPVTEPSPAARDILRAVLPSFYVVTPDLAYRRSLLAEEPRVERGEGRMEISFTLRPDARWSDGTPITVADVAFTVEVMQHPDVPTVDAEGFERVEDVVEEGPNQGALVLDPPVRAWRELFSAGRFVLPAHAAEEPTEVAGWNRGPPVSGGPFEVGEIVEGRSVTLEPNAQSWTSPAAARIEVLAVPDPTTALQLLRDGEVDVVAPMLGVSWGHRLEGLPGVEAAGTFGSHLVAMVANVARLPEAAERRLLADAVDRLRFAEAIVRGEGRLADSVIAPQIEGARPAWDRYGRGPPRELPSGGELELVYIRTELLELTARFLQAEVQRAGGDLELVGLEPDVFWTTFLPERRFDLALVEVRGGAAANVARWSGPPDGIWSSLTGFPDVGGALARAQERLAAGAAVLPLYQPRTSMGWREGVTGVQPNPTAEGPLWNAEAWGISDV
jgi:ABC-type transport system substrate-binding protein